MTAVYVATTGNDSTGTGAIGTPWKTISKGMTAAATGDTLNIRAGTYAEGEVVGHDTLTIQNYVGEAVVIQRASGGTALGLKNSRNITLKQNPSGGTLEIRSTVAGDGHSSGILVYYDSSVGGYSPSGITIDRVTVDNIAGWGIQVKDAATVIVQNCDVSHCGTGIRLYNVTGASFVQYNNVHHMDRMNTNTVSPTNDDFGGLGIALDYATSGATVQYNNIYECHATSYDYVVDGGAVEFYGASSCTVQWNTAYNNEGFLETGSPNATTYPMDGNIIRRNLVYGRLSYDTTTNSGAGDTPGILVRAGTNLKILNNTFDVDDGQDIFRIQEGTTTGRDAPITNLIVENNILVSRNTNTKCVTFNHAPMTTSGIVFNYNLIYNSVSGANIVASRASNTYAATAVAGWRTASGYSANDVWNADPVWVNRSVRDYHLQTTSPAKNTGVVNSPTTDGYTGTFPDIGAFEFATLPPPGGPTAAPVITFPAADGNNTNGVVTISGTAVVNVSVELFDGATSKGITIAVAGAWSFTLPGVTAGVHTYTAKATDSGSSVSAASNTRIITVGLTAPTVTAVSPVDGATGVATSVHPSVTFSTAMDTSTITTSSFTVKANGVEQTGTIAFSGGNTIATFTPTVLLPNGTVCTITLSSVIRDTTGNSLA